MKAHRIETQLTQNGTLILEQLPFQAGESVEVIVLDKTPTNEADKPYPLRDHSSSYVNPTEPVSISDWENA